MKIEEESERYLLDQENLYWGSNFLNKKWYRKIYGGKWRLLKFGKYNPPIGLFCEVLDSEIHLYTGVNTRFKKFKYRWIPFI